MADYIAEQGFRLTAASDYEFMKNVFTMLQSLFSYSPPFKFDEFFAPGHAVNRKLTFVLTLINLIKQKQASLHARRASSKTKQVTFRQEDSVAMPSAYYEEPVTRKALHRDYEPQSILVNNQKPSHPLLVEGQRQIEYGASKPQAVSSKAGSRASSASSDTRKNDKVKERDNSAANNYYTQKQSNALPPSAHGAQRQSSRNARDKNSPMSSGSQSRQQSALKPFENDQPVFT